jgi:hypothetical protein
MRKPLSDFTVAGAVGDADRRGGYVIDLTEKKNRFPLKWSKEMSPGGRASISQLKVFWDDSAKGRQA